MSVLMSGPAEPRPRQRTLLDEGPMVRSHLSPAKSHANQIHPDRSRRPSVCLAIAARWCATPPRLTLLGPIPRYPPLSPGAQGRDLCEFSPSIVLEFVPLAG